MLDPNYSLIVCELDYFGDSVALLPTYVAEYFTVRRFEFYSLDTPAWVVPYMQLAYISSFEAKVLVGLKRPTFILIGNILPFALIIKMSSESEDSAGVENAYLVQKPA